MHIERVIGAHPTISHMKGWFTRKNPGPKSAVHQLENPRSCLLNSGWGNSLEKNLKECRKKKTNPNLFSLVVQEIFSFKKKFGYWFQIMWPLPLCTLDLAGSSSRGAGGTWKDLWFQKSWCFVSRKVFEWNFLVFPAFRRLILPNLTTYDWKLRPSSSLIIHWYVCSNNVGEWIKWNS